MSLFFKCHGTPYLISITDVPCYSTRSFKADEKLQECVLNKIFYANTFLATAHERNLISHYT
jgi:hypothetical protein